MARRATRADALAAAGGLNLTPLLDIIFNLIFFFILATNIQEKEQYTEIDIPSSSTSAARTIEPKIPIIAYRGEGAYELNGEAVTAEELERELTVAAKRDNVAEAVILIDGDTAVQSLIDVGDICRRAGIPKLMPQVEEAAR